MHAFLSLDGMPAMGSGEPCESGLVAQAGSLSHTAAPRMPFGIDKRILWTTSRVAGSPDPPPPYRIDRSFPRLKFEQPLYLMKEPGSDYLFVIQRYGKIVRFRNNQQADKAPLFLDTGRETYAMAFHPNYAHTGYLYVFMNGTWSKTQRNRIVRYQVDPQHPDRCDPKTEFLLVEWDSTGHDGGCLAFGPDGKLYISVGDSTSGSDPLETGQDLSDLLASMIRIDVDHPDPGKPYGVPKDNPFVRMPGARPEIWAYGLRNPWRFTFDSETGNLWLGDVGQDLWEMIHLIKRGGNYGWSVMEGSHPFQLHRKRGPTPIVPPIVEHPHSEFRSIIGGFVYHGSRLKELRGAYIYGDHETGKIWGLRYDGTKVTWNQELAQSTVKIVAFGEDREGELYVVPLSGEIFRLEPAPPAMINTRFPSRLSETGLFTSVKDHQPAPGLIPYSVNSPLWSDNAHKDRYLALPGDAQIEFNPYESWDFPDGTVMVKTFSLDRQVGDPSSRRRVETRLLTRQQGQWHGYTYLWNDSQTDAELVQATGTDRTFPIRDANVSGGEHQQSWHYPSRAECMVCHSRAAKFVLGLSTPQLNKDHDYGGVVANQLQTLEHLGLFSSRLVLPPDQYRRLADPYDQSAPLDERARSYLHSNCSHCHVTDGGGNARMQLRYPTPVVEMNTLNVRPQHENFGVAEARLIAAGDPKRSILYERISRLGPGRMPPLSSSVVDARGQELFRDWIKQLKTKPDIVKESGR